MSPGPFRTIPLDVSAVRDAGLLRLVGAAICVAMAGWLAVIRPSWRIGVFAALGVMVAAIWVRRYWRSRREVQTAEARFLALEPARLRIARGAEDPLELPWDRVAAVDVDEDRLEVRLRVVGEEPLYIEPVYGGMGVYELAEAVAAAHDAASASAA